MNEPSSLPGKGYISRRRFFVRAAALVGAPLAVIYGIPLVGTVLGPMYKKTKTVFTRIKGFRKAPVGKPVELPLPCVQTDAFMREDVVENIWVVKQAAAADSSVFSPICPHLGCRYVWNEALNKFVCPCHGSIFSIKGKVLAGPAPRPLDTLPSKVDDNGTLEVMWERYEPGTPEKKTI